MCFIFGLLGTLATMIGEPIPKLLQIAVLVALVTVAVSAIMGTFAGRRLRMSPTPNKISEKLYPYTVIDSV